MPLPNMSPAQLLEAARVLAERVPDAELVKNDVGNLTVIQDEEMTGWVDLRYGRVHLFADEG